MPQCVTAKLLREERFELAKEVRRMADMVNTEKRDFTPEEKIQWEKVNADYEAYGPRIKTAERADAIDLESRTAADAKATLPGREDQTTRPNGDGTLPVTEETRCLALQGWLRASMGKDIRKTHRDAIKAIKASKTPGMAIGKRSLDFTLNKSYRDVRRFPTQYGRKAGRQSRALSIVSATAGQYTIPQGFVNNLEMALLAYANVREYADVMRTETGNDLPWPTVNDTTNKGRWVTENTTVNPTDTTFGQLMFHAFKQTSDFVLVPVELLEDSAFDLAAWLGDALGIRLARLQADAYTFGDGVGKPTGYITAATSGLTFASATAIAADEIYTLKHSVDPAYRPDAVWTMHDNTLLKIKLLKDGIGRYLWQSGLAANAPDTLDGDEIFINQSMDQVATGKKSLAYGDFSKFKIRDVNQVRLRRLVERFADSDQEGFVMFYRTDSNLLNAGTNPLKFGTHP